MVVVAGCNTLFTFSDDKEKDNSGTFCLFENESEKPEEGAVKDE